MATGSKKQKSVLKIKLASAKENSFWYSKRGKVWMSTFLVLVIFAITTGVWMYREGIRNKAPSSQGVKPPAAVQNPETSPTPSPTPEELDISVYKVELLNGSGKQGEAARAKVLLEEDGFNVISIGNSDQLGFLKTVIQTKPDVPAEVALKLKSTLEKTYTITDSLGQLPSGEMADVVVTIGSLKGQIGN